MRDFLHSLIRSVTRTVTGVRGSTAPSERNRWFEVVLDNMSQGVCLFDGSSRLVLANARYREIYGLSEEASRPGTSLAAIIRARVAAGTGPAMSCERYLEWRAEIAAGTEQSDTIVELANGQAVAINHRPMPDGGWVATHEDVTERRMSERRLTFMARHDVLTGLPNRLMLREHIATASSRFPAEASIAVMCLDLNRFKHVNDSYGHPVGDALLCAVSGRLRACVRDSELVARFGGDEFAIVQIGAEQPAHAMTVAARIIEALAQPFEIAGRSISIGTSVGIAVGRIGLDDGDTLLKNADAALYRSKADPRGEACLFASELHEAVLRRRALEADLREALDGNQLEVHFQPLFGAGSQTLCCFEALVRWHHPTRGLVATAEFIPIAEEIGIVSTMGAWVLRTACHEAACWPSHVRVAVNLSVLQFQGGELLETVRTALADAGLAPERLELEITESLLLRDGGTLETLHALRTLGVRIVLDDFGTGRSSLSYLRSFPFDKIKIDGLFTRDVNDTSEALAIIRAVTYLGRTLRIDVTAEGVETRDQLERLVAEGCTEVQGFLFGPPRSAHELQPLLLASAAGARFRPTAIAAAA